MITDTHVFQYPPPRLPSPHVPWCPPRVAWRFLHAAPRGCPWGPRRPPLHIQVARRGGGYRGVASPPPTRHDMKSKREHKKQKQKRKRKAFLARRTGWRIYFPICGGGLERRSRNRPRGGPAGRLSTHSASVLSLCAATVVSVMHPSPFNDSSNCGCSKNRRFTRRESSWVQDFIVIPAIVISWH